MRRGEVRSNSVNDALRARRSSRRSISLHIPDEAAALRTDTIRSTKKEEAGGRCGQRGLPFFLGLIKRSVGVCLDRNRHTRQPYPAMLDETQASKRSGGGARAVCWIPHMFRFVSTANDLKNARQQKAYSKIAAR